MVTRLTSHTTRVGRCVDHCRWKPGCELVTGGGCDEGELCDLDEGDDWLDPAILCSPGMDAHADGEECDAVYGPYCNAGYHCRPNATK